VILPLAQLPPARLATIRMLATDIDGTMTVNGRISLQVLQTWHAAHERGLRVLLVTGRSSGEALGLARYLPDATWAVAENGARLLIPDQPPELLVPPRPTEHLRDVAREIAPERPLLPTADAFAREGDLAFERDGRTDAEVLALQQLAHARGVELIWSSVHIHLSAHRPDKGAAVLQVAARWQIAPQHIATIGDSHNDEGLWQAERFGVTVGTAEVAGLHLRHVPEWQTHARGGEGWCELVTAWLGAQKN
jgi:HAD superfamily hydrolase (TIGR01484 family)